MLRSKNLLNLSMLKILIIVETKAGCYETVHRSFVFLSFVEDPEFFGGEELKVRSNKKMSF
jgi:hypothetical protein